MPDDASDTVRLELRTTHALVAAFVVGLFAGGFLVSTVGGVTGALVQGNQPSQPTDTQDDPSPSPTRDQQQDTIDPSKISLKGEPTMGKKDAPVTIVLYEDMQCPFCKRFETNTLPKIVENYVKTGKVRLVWKDFPIPQLDHNWAEPAAAAAECVYRQDAQAFWPVKDKIFKNQDSLTQSNVESKIKTWAAAEGVSKSAVQSCLDNGNPMKEVNEDKQEGSSIGASGTPTVFVNGQKIVGAQPYSQFKSAIESELSG